MIFLNKGKETPASTCVFLPVGASRTLAALSPGAILSAAINLTDPPTRTSGIAAPQHTTTLEASTVHGGLWSGLGTLPVTSVLYMKPLGDPEVGEQHGHQQGG